jgi:hypothetical protein
MAKMLGLAVSTMALALSAAVVEAVPLSPPLPFTVSEGSVPGSIPFVVVADRFSHTYSTAGFQGVVNPDLIGPGDTFTQVGNATASLYLLGVVPVLSQLNSFLPPFGYKLYALFSASGEADLIPPFGSSPAGILGIYSTFTMSFFLDPSQDTSLPDGAGVPAAGAGEDILIATASLTSPSLCAPEPSCGIAHTFPSVAAGDFAMILDFLLTPAGSAYFTAPVPFHNLLALSGVVSEVTGGFGGPFTTKGSGDAFFTRQIPAPASLVLLGLGVLGAAVGLRRRPRR